MILLFQLIIITSIWVLGVKISVSEKMIFSQLGDYGEKKVEEGYKIFDALWVCPFCMPTFHSLIGYGFAVGIGVIHYWGWNLVFMYPLVLMGSSITAGFTWTAYTTINAIKENYTLQNEYLKNEKQDNIN